MNRVAALVVRHFGRVTSGEKLIPEVDGLRFLAILPVVLHHLQIFVTERSPTPFLDTPWSRLLQDVIRQGRYGVDLFFVLSGFILALPFARAARGRGNPVNLKRYYLRRLTRIEPPYVVSLLLLFALSALVKGADTARALLPNLGASLLYVHTLLLGENSRINSVAWSLEVEVQFYLVVPLLVHVFRLPVRTRRFLLLLGAVAPAVANPLGWPGARPSLLVFLQYFLVGFLLADLYLTAGGWRQTRRTFLADGWVLAAMLAWYGLHRLDWAVSEVVLPGVLGVVVWAAFRGRALGWICCNLFIRTVGGMCYSIYLLHYPTISLVGRFTVGVDASPHYPLHFLIQALLVLPAVLMVAALFFVLVERPCMVPDWPRRLVQRLSPGRA